MPWLKRLSIGDGTSRLVCLPYAGGEGSTYTDWANWLPPHIELWAPDLPAHGHRMLEEPVDDMQVLVSAMADELCRDDKPTSLFGHSLGALVAFELARRLQERSRPVGCLVVSGMRAPQTVSARSTPSDAEILADLRSQGVTPPALFTNPALLELVMPGLRADYKMALGYRYRSGSKLSSAVFALAGARDHQVSNASLAAWAEQTETKCQVCMWEGGHMYLISHAEDVAKFVADCHARWI